MAKQVWLFVLVVGFGALLIAFGNGDPWALKYFIWNLGVSLILVYVCTFIGWKIGEWRENVWTQKWEKGETQFSEGIFPKGFFTGFGIFIGITIFYVFLFRPLPYPLW